jgi:HlyD family secretion protein
VPTIIFKIKEITMKKTLLILTLLSSIIMSATACTPAANPAEAAPAPQTESIEPIADNVGPPVEVASVEIGAISLLLNYSGNLQAQKEVHLVPKVAGEITQVLVQPGDIVKKGDPIAMIDDEVYALQLKQAQSVLAEAQLNLQKMEDGARPEEIAAARSALAITNAALTDAEFIDDNERTAAALNLANARSALQLAQAEYDKIAWAGQVSQTPQALKLEQATNAYEASLAAYNLQTNPGDAQLAPLEGQRVQAELNLALAEEPFRPVDFEIIRAKIGQAETAVELAQLQLGYTIIEAPLDGVVAEMYIDEGDMVGNNTPLGLVLSQEIEVKLNIEESRLAQVETGQAVSLRVAAYPAVEFPAIVTNVAPHADSNTHTFAVTVTPLDKEGQLRSGMFADTTVLTAENKNTLLVPVSAVVSVDGQPAVYAVTADDTVEQRAVVIGLSNKHQVEILSGVKAGESVVINGQNNLQDGVTVNVVPEI